MKMKNKHLFYPNKIIKKTRSGQTAIGIGFSFAAPEIVDMIGMTNRFDYIYLDGEHGTFTAESIAGMARAAHCYDLSVVGRIPSLDQQSINMFLNVGVVGLICPRISNAEQARCFVDYCYYPPDGKRGWSSFSRANLFNNKELSSQFNNNELRLNTERLKRHNEEMLLIGQIESEQGIRNLDSILATDKLDIFMTGTGDLSLELGGMDDPVKIDNIINKVQSRVRSAGKKMLSDVMSHKMVSEVFIEGISTFAKTEEENGNA